MPIWTELGVYRIGLPEMKVEIEVVAHIPNGKVRPITKRRIWKSIGGTASTAITFLNPISSSQAPINRCGHACVLNRCNDAERDTVVSAVPCGYICSLCWLADQSNKRFWW